MLNLKFQKCAFSNCQESKIGTKCLCINHEICLKNDLKCAQETVLKKYNCSIIRESGIYKNVHYDIAWNVNEGMFGFVCRVVAEESEIIHMDNFPRLEQIAGDYHGGLYHDNDGKHSKSLSYELREPTLEEIGDCDTCRNLSYFDDIKLPLSTDNKRLIGYFVKDMHYDDHPYKDANDCWSSFLAHVHYKISSFVDLQIVEEMNLPVEEWPQWPIEEVKVEST